MLETSFHVSVVSEMSACLIKMHMLRINQWFLILSGVMCVPA